jgi:hypothetical protein
LNRCSLEQENCWDTSGNETRVYVDQMSDGLEKTVVLDLQS